MKDNNYIDVTKEVNVRLEEVDKYKSNYDVFETSYMSDIIDAYKESKEEQY